MFRKPVLVGLISDNEIRERRSCGLGFGHFVHAAFLQTPGGFKYQVVQQIKQRIPGVVYITTAPRIAYRIRRQRTLVTDEVVVNVALGQSDIERNRATRTRCIERVRQVALVLREPSRSREIVVPMRFDVADLFGAYAQDEVTVRSGGCAADVHRLEHGGDIGVKEPAGEGGDRTLVR